MAGSQQEKTPHPCLGRGSSSYCLGRRLQFYYRADMVDLAIGVCVVPPQLIPISKLGAWNPVANSPIAHRGMCQSRSSCLVTKKNHTLKSRKKMAGNSIQQRTSWACVFENHQKLCKKDCMAPYITDLSPLRVASLTSSPTERRLHRPEGFQLVSSQVATSASQPTSNQNIVEISFGREVQINTYYTTRIAFFKIYTLLSRGWQKRKHDKLLVPGQIPFKIQLKSYLERKKTYLA